MATKIRLARGGAKKRPYYSIVVADQRSPRDGRFIEKIGAYNPSLPKGDEKRVVFDKERMQHWLKTGAQPTERVERFLRAAGLITTKAVYRDAEKALRILTNCVSTKLKKKRLLLLKLPLVQKKLFRRQLTHKHAATAKVRLPCQLTKHPI